MRESKVRSLMKAISWRIFGSLVTGAISFILMHQLAFALSMSILDFFSKIIFFYCHERVWDAIPYGRDGAITHKEERNIDINPANTRNNASVII